MADLHMAINNSPFGWYAYNVTLDKNKVPVDPAAVPRMPDQIKISVTVQVEGREKEIAFYVTPCSAESPEEFLLYTWDQYMKSCKAKLPASLREDGPTHFRLFPLALGVSATNAWNKVLEENAVNAADEGDGTNDTSYENFKDCVALFLEEISGVKYLGDVIIRFLSRAKKPLEMSPDACFRRRSTMMSFMDTGVLRSKLPRPTAYALAESVFLAHPKGYQERFAETHDEIEEDTTAMRSAFSQYHANDVKNGTIASLKKGGDKKRPASRDDNGAGKSRRTDDRRYPRSGKSTRDRYRRGYRDRDRRDRYDHKDRDGRGGDRGDRYRHQDRQGNGYKPSDKGKKPYKAPDAAHHVEEASRGSRDRSRSRSPSRSPSRSRSRSASHDDRSFEGEEEGYAMASGANRDYRDPQIPMELEYSDEEKSRHDSYFDKKKRRLASLLSRKGKKSSTSSEPRK